MISVPYIEGVPDEHAKPLPFSYPFGFQLSSIAPRFPASARFRPRATGANVDDPLERTA